MRFRERRRGQSNHERWLVSYADFVTLLFAFFVVLYASAQVNRQRALQLSNAIEAGFQQLAVFDGSTRSQTVAAHGVTGASATTAASLDRVLDKGREADELRKELERALAVEIGRNEVAFRENADGLVLSLREVGFFDSGLATLKPGAQGAFGRVANILREHACAVRIEGHTDDVPIHTAQFASNWELSTARATTMVRMLIDDYGISPALLSAAGYAEFHPVSTNDTIEGRQLNRRVDIVILNTGRMDWRPVAGSTASPASESEKHASAEPHDTAIAAADVLRKKDR